MTLGLFLEAIHRWLGPTKRVMADGTTWVTERIDAETGKPHKIDVPDSLGVLAVMESGARVDYRVSAITHAPARGTASQSTGRRQRCTGRQATA